MMAKVKKEQLEQGEYQRVRTSQTQAYQLAHYKNQVLEITPDIKVWKTRKNVAFMSQIHLIRF